jgi:hypothetical protein
MAVSAVSYVRRTSLSVEKVAACARGLGLRPTLQVEGEPRRPRSTGRAGYRRTNPPDHTSGRFLPVLSLPLPPALIQIQNRKSPPLASLDPPGGRVKTNVALCVTIRSFVSAPSPFSCSPSLRPEGGSSEARGGWSVGRSKPSPAQRRCGDPSAEDVGTPVACAQDARCTSHPARTVRIQRGRCASSADGAHPARPMRKKKPSRGSAATDSSAGRRCGRKRGDG